MWWVGAVFCMVATSLVAANRPLSVQLQPGVRAVFDSGYEIEIRVVPHRGDAWTRLALRVTGDAGNWKRLAEINGQGDNLLAGIEVRVPFAMARPELRKDAVRALFPQDGMTPDGWLHVVVGDGPVEGESFWRIAEWFTGDGGNYSAIRKASGIEALSTRRGDRVVIPRSLLLPPFRSSAPAAPAPIENAEDDPVEQPVVVPAKGSSSDEVIVEARRPAVSTYDLEYVRDSAQPYAIYRLRKGEALYSSVVIRFTGRVFARDVNEVVKQIVDLNGITDVSKLPVGFRVKIPMELLTPEYRPEDDPRRIEFEASRRESARLTRRVAADNLSGVHVIIDAGHGGRDVGTTHDGMWESTYVYDVAVRLKAILESRSRSTVRMTTRSASLGFSAPQRDQLPARTDHQVLTSPVYDLENPVIGVNLRWYLANSYLRSAVRQGVEEEKVIFLSLHADSLHPSLRGAMAYVPGQRYTEGTFRKSGDIYLTRSEVKESPTVTHTREEALRAEGLSTELAESVIDAFDDAGLKIHPFNPIRNHVVREGKEWVPAVIRYNKVPTRILLEICNLGNPDDRSLMQTRAFREKVALAIYQGILDFYAQRQESPERRLLANTAAR